jgi:hypothetical protein
MTNQHPITPPPELIEQWMQAHSTKYDLARHAAQWGADTELEACCGALDELNDGFWSEKLRSGRRPKPPSLKEQAIAALSEMSIEPCLINDVDVNAAVCAKYNTIRRALEALDD